jgi:tRNA pseudouridine38-40 synthase
MRHAFSVAYDGSRYFGYTRQPEKPTIEGELLKAFERSGLYGELRKAWYRVAARTDRNVSAVGQVIALNTDGEPDIKEINSLLPRDIVVLATAEVSEDFDPRSEAVAKHYRYVCEVPEGFDIEKVRIATEYLEGTHDFKCFCKREPKRTTIANLASVSVQGGDFLKFDFRARAFLRQQVRRMVSALLAVGSGEMEIEDLRIAIEGRAKHSLRPAPPWGLFLVRIQYERLLLQPRNNALRKFTEHFGAQWDLRSREMLKSLREFLQPP